MAAPGFLNMFQPQQGNLKNSVWGSQYNAPKAGSTTMGVKAAAPTVDNSPKPKTTLPSQYQSNNQPASQQPAATSTTPYTVGNYAGVKPGPEGTPLTPQQQQQSQSYQPASYSGIVNNLTQASQTGNAAPGIIQRLQSASTLSPQNVTAAQQHLQDVQNEQARLLNNIGSTPGMSLTEATGREGQINQQALTAINAAQTGVANAQQQQQNVISGLTNAGQVANTTQQLQQSGLYNAGQLAQPQLGAYGQNYYQPLQAGQNQGGGGSMDPQTQASTLAQQVISGQRSYQDALSAMGAYGGQGATFLNNAINGINPNFNYAQANAFGTTQGQVAPNLNMAQKAIDNLNSTFSTLPWYQKSGIPAINALTGLLSEVGVGTGTQKDKDNAISEARTQVANALGVATNTTPSAWTATVQGWFPDNATPDQVSAGVQQFQTLAQNRQDIFGTPGAVSSYTNPNAQSNTSGSTYSW